MVERDRFKQLFKIGENCTEIQKMLSLAQRYGLSHVCAKSEFKNIEDLLGNEKDDIKFNYPYLDISLHKVPGFELDLLDFGIEFYFRGTMDFSDNFISSNLFEFLLSASSHGAGFINFINQACVLATFTEQKTVFLVFGWFKFFI